MSNKRIFQNCIVSFISCGIALLLGEILIATFLPQNLGTWGMTRDGLTSHVPNISVYLNQFGQQISINSHGMRDREHAWEKPSGIFRILLLGDSFMEANQVAFEEAFPHLLGVKLGRHVEVINASVSGWGTDDELTYLMRHGFQFRPDLVLVGLTLHNDLQDNLAEEFHSFVNGAIQEKPRQEIPAVDYAVLKVKEFLASRSHLYQMLLRVKRFSWAQQEGNRLSGHVASLLSKESSTELAQAWEMTRQLLGKMRLESERHGAKVVIFLIPLSVQVSEERLKGFLDARQISVDRLVLDQPQLRMRDIGVAEGLEVIDLLPEFQRNERERPNSLYLKADGHWTAMGHRLGAGIVAERLASSAVVPQP